ncbi:hypothetical protein V8E53_001977 [Lactarius tabidus]
MCNGVVPHRSSVQLHCGHHVTAVGNQVTLQQHKMPLHCGRHTATLPWDTDATTGHKSPCLARYTALHAAPVHTTQTGLRAGNWTLSSSPPCAALCSNLAQAAAGEQEDGTPMWAATATATHR